MKILPKITTKLANAAKGVTNLFRQLEDRFDDEDAMRAAASIHKVLSAVQKLSKLVPALAAYNTAIKVAIYLCEAIEDDGDLTKEDLARLILKKDEVIAVFKQLKAAKDKQASETLLAE